MIEVVFCHRDEVEDEKLEFAVIIARFNNKFIFCRHRERVTWEVPGGHREVGESIIDTAKRELFEESGAIEFTITPISVYGVKNGSVTTFGMLFFADVHELGDILSEYEIAEIMISDTLPENLTYPEIQPELWAYIRKDLELD